MVCASITDPSIKSKSNQNNNNNNSNKSNGKTHSCKANKQIMPSRKETKQKGSTTIDEDEEMAMAMAMETQVAVTRKSLKTKITINTHTHMCVCKFVCRNGMTANRGSNSNNNFHNGSKAQNRNGEQLSPKVIVSLTAPQPATTAQQHQQQRLQQLQQ